MIFNDPAASSISFKNCAVPGSVELPMTVTRESLGTISFKSSSRLPLISGARVDNPVMFPPGRAKLATNPLATGSPSCAKTMEIVVVASLAARVTDGPAVTMISTLRRTSSAASSRSRSAFPSAYRNSTTMFFPSTYPSSRSPSRNAAIRAATGAGLVPARNPIREIFVGCCAFACSPHTVSATMSVKSPAHFRFAMVRQGSPQVLDFRLPEQEFGRRSQAFSFIVFFSSIQNPKSQIQNYLITRSALASTLGGTIRFWIFDCEFLDCGIRRPDSRKEFELHSPDYPIRPRQHVGRDRQADLLRRLEIDHQLELLRPFH